MAWLGMELAQQPLCSSNLSLKEAGFRPTGLTVCGGGGGILLDSNWVGIQLASPPVGWIPIANGVPCILLCEYPGEHPATGPCVAKALVVRSIHHITPKKLQINVLWLIYVGKGLDNNILKV